MVTINHQLHIVMLKKSLLFAMLMAFLMPQSMMAQDKGNTDMWDFVKSFRTTTGRQYGIASEGNYIYTSVYSPSSTVTDMFFKYDYDGNLIESFNIPGCEYIRDMTYDGQYFYGGSGSSSGSNIYCFDLVNKTFIGTISTSCEDIRHCSYDPVNDGFWIGTSTDLMLVNRQGTTISVAAGVPASNIYCNGTGYYTAEDQSAHLLMFCNSGITPYIHDYNITTGTWNNTPELDFSTTPGYIAYGGAGGAFVGDYNGSTCFYGDSQASPNFIGVYALDAGDPPLPPTPPTPPTGDIVYDFEDAYMTWTTIDADGDGYNWTLERNWGNANNLYSVRSASRDDVNSLVLYPDNYLVSPYKLDCEEVTFLVCAQDQNYPLEHIGLAISTESNTDPDDFTLVWEETLYYKSQGPWHFFSVDLRAYQGQDIWIAFRHFNSSDQFMVTLDDITLYRKYNGIGEVDAAGISVYPNPAADRVNVNSAMTVNSYEIYNVVGAMIRREEVGLKSFDVDVDALPAGTYLIKLETEGKTQTRRFVKQ